MAELEGTATSSPRSARKSVKDLTSKFGQMIQGSPPQEDDGIRRRNFPLSDDPAFDGPALHKKLRAFLDGIDRDPKKAKARAEIGSRLLLGSLDHAIEIAEDKEAAKGVVGVVNLYGGKDAEKYIKPMYDRMGIEYLGINAEDEEGYPLLKAHAEEVLEWIKTRPPGRVMVHCREGKNRSGAMVTAWLIQEEGMDLLEAVRHVIGQRNICLQNLSFAEQLVEFAGKIDQKK